MNSQDSNCYAGNMLRFAFRRQGQGLPRLHALPRQGLPRFHGPPYN
jgi:hypothetical protein